METRASTRVSILEDQPLMRQSMSDVLQEAGFEVVGQYSDPELFLSRVGVDHPEVAIVDLNLPDAHGGATHDGVAVLVEVHNRHPDVRVLVFSGSMEPETVDRCYREGAAGYLDKLSGERDALIRTVKAVARGDRLFPFHLIESPLGARPKTPESPILQSLSMREREVLSYVAAGADNLKIATFLNISERTVKAHVSSLYRKLGSENRTQLALTALQIGVRPAPDV